jgi:integrase
MAVRKLKTSWWIDFQFGGKRYRKRSPENTRSGASAYELLLRQSLARGEQVRKDSIQRKPTFGQFAALWLEDYVKPNNKHSEQLAKKYVLAKSLVPFFGEKPIGEIKGHDIERYKAQQLDQGFSNKTITNRLTVLNKCLVTAYEWLEMEGGPPKIKWPKWTLPEIDYLSPAECEHLLRHAHGVMHEMVLMALRTGMRQGELRGLQWSSIDWLTRSVVVRHSRDDRGLLVPPKSGRSRHIPLDTDVYGMLYARKRDTGYVYLGRDKKPYNNYRMNYAIRRLCKNASFRTVGWHTLRHTFASHLAMRGVPLPAIKELMGHSTITTTMRYAHVAPSTLRSAIDMLNPKTLVATDFGQPGVNQWEEAQKKISEPQRPDPKYA